MKGRGRKRAAQPQSEEENGRIESEEQIVESEGLEDNKNEEEENEEEEDGGGEERTKLDDGFFEIEAIRRKRFRKGQLQYLIKWHGWPETANTWEPLENLQSCSDVIDAFEESLHSGKLNRNRKRKYSGPDHLQSMKKNETVHEVSIAYKFPMVPLDNSDVSDVSAACPRQGHSNGNANNVRKSNRVKENGSKNGSKKIYGRKDENVSDTKLRELKGTISLNGVNPDYKLAKRSQGGKSSHGNGLANGLQKAGHMESVQVQSDHRTGAKRRKSGSVKRFKQDLSSSSSNLTQNVGYGTTDAHIEVENLGLTVPVITKILKPVGFSASVSDNTQDVSVNFLAIRSDGKEVTVDNSYLKASNPLLLINFYEQHLKYNPPP